MRKIKYGIIGVGVQGSNYAGFLTKKQENYTLENCELGALCDIDPKVRAKCEKEYPGVPFYTDWKQLVDAHCVDAVITTVPHYLHPEIAIYCLTHGSNVLVEKPAGVYTKQVKEMNQCALQHPELAFGIMFNQRTNRLYQRVRELVASGELGEIRRSNWIINTWWRPDSYYRQSAWRATWGGEGGGVLVNQAPHQLDLWQWICGKPDTVYAKCVFGDHRQIAVENDVTIVTGYANGATGCFVTCTHDPIGTDRLEIDLSGGKIVVEDSKKATVRRLKRNEDELNQTVRMEELGKLLSANGSSGNELYTEETFESEDKWGVQHMTVLANYADHLLNGTPLLAPGTDGINGVRLADAALLSAWLGREIQMPFDDSLYLAELNKHIRAEGKFPEREG